MQRLYICLSKLLRLGQYYGDSVEFAVLRGHLSRGNAQQLITYSGELTLLAVAVG